MPYEKAPLIGIEAYLQHVSTTLMGADDGEREASRLRDTAVRLVAWYEDEQQCDPSIQG
jgi:hypothetical protein